MPTSLETDSADADPEAAVPFRAAGNDGFPHCGAESAGLTRGVVEWTFGCGSTDRGLENVPQTAAGLRDILFNRFFKPHVPLQCLDLQRFGLGRFSVFHLFARPTSSSFTFITIVGSSKVAWPSMVRIVYCVLPFEWLR